MRREKNPQYSCQIQRRIELFKEKFENSLFTTKTLWIKIQNDLQLFYKNLFKYNRTKSYYDFQEFLGKITIPVLTSEKANICEGDLVKSALFISVSSMQDCTSPGNDRLTKELTFVKCNKRSIDELY